MPINSPYSLSCYRQNERINKYLILIKFILYKQTPPLPAIRFQPPIVQGLINLNRRH